MARVNEIYFESHVSASRLDMSAFLSASPEHRTHNLRHQKHIVIVVWYMQRSALSWRFQIQTDLLV